MQGGLSPSFRCIFATSSFIKNTELPSRVKFLDVAEIQKDSNEIAMDIKVLLRTAAVEFSASALFTLAYFILVGRVQSDHFTLNFLQLSALLAFIYVVAVFVSSFRFEADVFPFYSLMRGLFRKTWVPIWLNIPAQLIGTVTGLFIYLMLHNSVLSLSPVADISRLTIYQIQDFPLRAMIMAVLVFILVYSMIIIRQLFLLKGMTGTVLIAVLVFVLGSITIPLDQVSIVTWWQDTVLNLYHSVQDPQRELFGGWTIALSALVMLLTIFLAYVKATQYNRPRNEHYEEPGEYNPQFSKDYDI